jgi:hypothetical protein
MILIELLKNIGVVRRFAMAFLDNVPKIVSSQLAPRVTTATIVRRQVHV